MLAVSFKDAYVAVLGCDPKAAERAAREINRAAERERKHQLIAVNQSRMALWAGK